MGTDRDRRCGPMRLGVTGSTDPFWRTTDAESSTSACSRPRRSCSRHARALRAHAVGDDGAGVPAAGLSRGTVGHAGADADRLRRSCCTATSTSRRPGTPGGKVIISDWQAANQLNPYFSNAFANSQVYAATMRTLLVVTSGRPLEARPVGRADHLQRRTSRKTPTARAASRSTSRSSRTSSGRTASRSRLNDFKYTWRCVLDKAQVGISTLGWEEVDKIDVSADGNEATSTSRSPSRAGSAWSAASSSCPSTT